MRSKPFLLLQCSVLLATGNTPLPAEFTGYSVAETRPAARVEKPWKGRLASVLRREERLRQNRRTSVAQQQDIEQTKKGDQNAVQTTTSQQRTRRSIRRDATPSEKPTPGVPVVLDHPEIQDRHKELARDVLTQMPRECQNSLKHFYVRYDRPQSRGLGGKSSIILAGHVPHDEFRALFVHEFGHVLDLGCVSGNPTAGESPFWDGRTVMHRDDPSVRFYAISWIASNVQRADARPEDFVSGYASWDVFEDFAESFTYYMLHRSAFYERAQTNVALAAKFTWFQSHFPELPTLAESQHQWTGNVPWDITKLSYEWREPTHLASQEALP